MKKQDNKGFTLIELLVAVMVLAIVIVPLLHSFVTSFRVNAKSKQQMRATALAQNEMEIFEKEKIEDLIAMTDKDDPTKLVYTVTDEPNPSDPDDDGCYTFKRAGIINDDSGREMFDVVVTLNPERVISIDRYYDFNTEPLMQMNTISNQDSGSFVQSIRSAGNAADYDTIVYGIFKERKNASGVGATWDIDDFEQKLKRRIIVNVSQVDDALGKITKAKVTYEYTCEDYDVMPNEYRIYTEERIMFDNTQTFDEAGNRIELKSLYLFYGPRYDTTKIDEIVIENEAKLPIDFYVVRQDIWKKDVDEVREVEALYQAKISIKDGVNGDTTYGKYWTNLNLNEPEIVGNGKQTQLSLVNYDNPTQVFNATEIMAATQMKKLGEPEAKDRIYTMEVKVYEKGADPSTEKPLVTMTGSKME